MIKPLVFKHYAANGRTVTACGRRIQPNSRESEHLHSDGHSSWSHDGGEPTCRKCRKALASTEVADIVRCSEDDSPTALRDAVAAYVEAEALAGRLGRGWMPRIWYNFGWHHEAVSGEVSVSGEGRRFGVYLDRAWKGSGTTPLAAVRAGIRLMEAARNVLDEKINAVQASVA